MTCDGCCFARQAHFCLVSACLSVFMSWSVDSVLVFDDTFWLCLDVNSSGDNFLFSSPSVSFLFTFASAFLLLPVAFVLLSFTSSWPRLFCSFHFPFLVLFFLLLVLSLHICIGLCAAPFHFYVISLSFISSFLFSSFCFCLQSRPSPALRCLFVSFPHPLFSFHLSHSPLSFPFSSLPPFSLSPRLISHSSLLSSHPSICSSVHPLNTLSFCPFSVTQGKPPSYCMTFCTPSPSRLSWCPAAAACPRWWPKLLACGT